jgi:hypothetical protein
MRIKNLHPLLLIPKKERQWTKRLGASSSSCWSRAAWRRRMRRRRFLHAKPYQNVSGGERRGLQGHFVREDQPEKQEEEDCRRFITTNSV